ncbi:MAG: hypothetical protein QOG38_1526, partial [Hyphomicrobiales bacterium]|nr:hypothetical protein [Hyphomicrobiales bacterium]
PLSTLPWIVLSPVLTLCPDDAMDQAVPFPAPS